MPDYSKGKIYTLRSYQTNEIYIGSTIDLLPKRLWKHKTDYKCWKNGKKPYITSFELIKYDDYYIELLELFPCNSKAELEKREGHHIRYMECVNKLIAGRTKKEYYIENKKKVLEYQKDYYEDNKDKIKEQKKEYRIENADKIKEQMKGYRIENVEKLKEKINCECGAIIRKSDLSRHQKTKKHQNFIKL
jgi:hypothetical protein